MNLLNQSRTVFLRNMIRGGSGLASSGDCWTRTSIIRQNSTLSSTDSSVENSGVYIHLPTRGLLEIRGKDASKFLQGLITNHMPRIESGGGGFLAAFLSPKGRVMSKVKMVGVTESYDVYSVLDAHAEETSNLDSSSVMERLANMNASTGSLDNRANNLMGYRAVVPKGHALNLPENYRRGSLEEYHVRRILNGVPEGMDDFIPGTSLPLECNLDYMNGGKSYSGS
ncbi:Iron-sulfur clusters incorporation protein [Podila clonocystis]|nr:Iron-sulfur clusters incorporation protein [Podila clonocystis]